ncbi:hypothetical protein OZX73_04370 [Bifidobacterium sp. ESL0775]|uniref:hypothetical protein n=1 Tax=Bifidobacterium sp. ESL0775 TaxID=2983230 RepID=UPI0023FA23AA|nr:hypothetical protein [Bifidobacterium sp. ESL0775]WEV68542.1 hypothetical protein OZX73_04370 [Bifidobacterium sp. ESL0775]
MALMPGFLWIFALLWAVAICAICIVKGALRKKSDHRPVKTVPWSVILMHVFSLILCCAPYAVYKLNRAQIQVSTRHWYASLGIPSAIVLGVFFVAELVLMFLQARRAQRDIVDDVLSNHHHVTKQ